MTKKANFLIRSFYTPLLHYFITLKINFVLPMLLKRLPDLKVGNLSIDWIDYSLRYNNYKAATYFLKAGLSINESGCLKNALLAKNARKVEWILKNGGDSNKSIEYLKPIDFVLSLEEKDKELKTQLISLLTKNGGKFNQLN